MLSRERGVGLLEALVALAILAVGVLGLLSAQLHIRAAMSSAVHRGQAIRLIDDLVDRMRAQPGSRPTAATGYLVDWDEVPAAPDCTLAACDAQSLARADLADWKRAIGDALPGGQGRVLSVGASASETAPMKLSVQVAWRHGEGPATDAGSAGQCPRRLTCHIAQVHVGR